MAKRKEFSILKWLVFPSMSLTLAAIVAWFNIVVFGLRDGAFYIAAVAIIAAFSIAINKYVGAENSRLAVAAFVFEIMLILVLGCNAIYSLSIQREMAVARQAEQSNLEALREIKQLKGSRTQREALKVVDKPQSAQSVFAQNERILLWLMAGELLAYILSAFTLYALSHLAGEKEPEPVEEEFPRELDTKKQAPARRGELREKSDTVSFSGDDTAADRKATQEGLKTLREVLKLIAFQAGKTHFKVDPKPGYVWIRQFRSEHGEPRTIAAARSHLEILDDAVRMDRTAFRERLERFLRENGFEI